MKGRARIVAGLLAFFAFDAHAGIGPNGLGPNGLGPNGLGPNGLGPNGLGPNGLGPNGLGPNGLGPNGLGPNGLGPNGLGPNGLDVNGLGPNGLGPNGLGPNGLILTIEPNGLQPDSSFKAWFEADPATASQSMRYFARCAYDGSTAIAYLDSTGKTWAWTGQYGLAMGSVARGPLELLSPLDANGPMVRSRMTADEGKWVSACILAHVNTQGTHQYISLRGNPPNPEAQQALALTVGELWTMSDYHGAFFGDLFTEGSWTPKISCSQHGDAAEAANLDVVLGRSCDSRGCAWLNADGSGNAILYAGRCANLAFRRDEIMNPLYTAADFSPVNPPTDAQTFHPIFVNGPVVSEFDFPPLPGRSSRRNGSAHLNPIPSQPLLPGGELGAGAAAGSGIITPAASIPFDLDPVHWTLGPTQTIPCAAPQACSGMANFFYGNPGQGWKVVGIRAGQVIEGVVRYTGHMTNTSASAINVDMQNPVTPVFPSYDPSLPEVFQEFQKPFTAVIRYSNCRSTPASATLAVSGPAGLGAPIGSEVWPSTIPAGATACSSGENFTWLQVYPVYGFEEDTQVATIGVRPTLKISVSGATQGEHCTGAKILKGDGETGTCTLRSIYFDWKRLKVMCRESGESQPVCRGDLILDFRNRKWDWFCAYGGAAISACTGADAPDLDAFAFIPGKPYCMPEDAKSFVGVCK